MSGGFRDDDRLGYGASAVEEAVRTVRARTAIEPRVALILGSGLGDFAERFEDRIAVPYDEIPGFPRATVAGHAGRLVLGRVGETPVAAQQGRFHVYEGWSASAVTFPLRVMHALGARIVVVTNAAGGINPRFAPGDFMIIDDQVNFQFRSPLRGRGPLVDETRFVDMAAAYTPRLARLAEETAAVLSLPGVHRGTYWGNLGPTYETPAEIAMARGLGGDAVGMSTVPEIVVAAQLRMETLGITCISNLAAGLSAGPLNHAEVIEVTSRRRADFTRFLHALVPQL